MSWMFCGKNSRTGQWMGYGVSCKCHKRGCQEKIDRGLSYVCGGMHEGGEYGCGYYFCGSHLFMSDYGLLCDKCFESLEKAIAEDGDAFQPVSGNVSGKAGVGPRIPNAGCGKDGGL
jgi:hypothetical protein